MNVYLVDGTYELFRHYYALPSAKDADGLEVAAVRGVLASMLRMIRNGATHIAVATDHVIESFRNELWLGYKTSAGVPHDLLAQSGFIGCRHGSQVFVLSLTVVGLTMSDDCWLYICSSKYGDVRWRTPW